MTTAAKTPVANAIPPAPIQADPVAITLQVISTPPAKLEDGMQLVSWSRRSTEKNPVDAANRFRGVVQSASVLQLPDGSTTSKFSKLLQNTINELADARFTAWVKDNMMATAMPASFTSMDSVLAFYAEEKQRAVMDGAKILTWLKASPTFAALNEKQQKSWLEKMPKMAAPSYAGLFSRENAATVISRIHADDLEAPEAMFIMERCNKIINALSEEDSL